MDNIEKMWKDINIEYSDMYSRLNYVSNKSSNILEKRPLKDKLILLMSDFREIINTMEKVSHSIDEIYANQGKIGTKIKEDNNILVKHYKNNSQIIHDASAS